MTRDLQPPPKSPQDLELTASPAEMQTPERDEAMTIPDQHRQAMSRSVPDQQSPEGHSVSAMRPEAEHARNQARGNSADGPQAAFAMGDELHRAEAQADQEQLGGSMQFPPNQLQTAESMGILDADMLLDEWPPRPGALGGPGSIDADVVNMLRRFDEHEPLHPYVASLSIRDVDACVALEEAAFPLHERCSREKFQYRLTACPFLCLGLFTSTNREPDDETRACFAAARAPDSSNPSHKSLLIGHVIGTLTTADAVTEASMNYPPNFFKPSSGQSTSSQAQTGAAASSGAQAPSIPSKDPPPVPRKDALPTTSQPSTAPGHHPLGRTLAVHSVCILPPFQHLRLGKILFRDYLQRMEGSGIADSAALLARPELVGWYSSSFGFEDKGTSDVSFGGGAWRDLRYDFMESTPSL